MNNDLVKSISLKIVAKYGIDNSRADKLATDLVEQIEAHGGNPDNEAQTDSAIDIVVRKWLNP